jgi:hypothetical protein
MIYWCRNCTCSVSMWIMEAWASACQFIPQLVLTYSSRKWEVRMWSNLKASFATTNYSTTSKKGFRICSSQFLEEYKYHSLFQHVFSIHFPSTVLRFENIQGIYPFRSIFPQNVIAYVMWCKKMQPHYFIPALYSKDIRVKYTELLKLVFVCLRIWSSQSI